MHSEELTQAIQAAANGLLKGQQEEQRIELLAACGKLRDTLETPIEAGQRIVLSALEPVALRLAIDMKILDVAASSKGPNVSLDRLVAGMGSEVDPVLVARLMRVLAGMNVLRETDHNIWSLTPLARTFVSPSPLTKAFVHLTSQNEVVSQLPTYFEKDGYQNPRDAYRGPFQYGKRTDLHYFDWLAENPRYQGAFNTAMGVSRLNGGEQWFDDFPVEARLGNGDPSRILFVDIGGGVGHDLVAFKKKFPDLQGKFIVQDLATVVEAVKDLPAGVEAMSHNFFEMQSVKGAKVYYLRTVLHDWPERQAREILASIRAAMANDSILLINENIMPSLHVSLYAAKLDLYMMAMFSSMDRTLGQFENLLDPAGFDLVAVWKPKVAGKGAGTLLECSIKI